MSKPHLGVPSEQEINEVIEAIKNSKFPVLLAGMRSSSQAETEAIRRLVQKQTYLLLKHSKVPA